MTDSTEKNDVATEEHGTSKTATEKDQTKTQRFCYFFLKKMPRSMAIMICFVGCCYFLVISANRLNSDVILQEFKATSSVGNENLQITVCPVAPFEQILALDFEVYTKRANNLRELEMGLLTTLNFSRDFKGTMDCLHNGQYVQRFDTVEKKLYTLSLNKECMIYANDLFTGDYPADLLEIYTWIRSYLSLYMLRLHKEGDVDFYDGIYKNIDLLEQDNATLPEYLKASARDLGDYITSDFTVIDNVNLNQPVQKIVASSLRTRFGSSCTSYTLADIEEGGKKLNQRYQLQMTFNRVELAYLLVFVTENRTFSDIPGATIMQPYRIPLDTTSILHIRRIEKTIKNEKLENCKSYDTRSSPGSHVECMEACILKKVVTHKNITCLMPWMMRNSTRGLTDKLYCNTSEDFLNTRDVTQKIFAGNISDCNHVCTESCEKLNILVKIMGIVRPAVFNNDQRHSLIIIVSNEMDEFRNRPAYGWGEFISEVFGSLSFILGIAFVALIDWLFATLLWLCGKLPYIPAMPPIINEDVYLRDVYYSIRHELYGEPIPMTISQTYLKSHERRRDAFNAVPSATTEKTDSDHKHPQFPRMHQRKSSLAIMSEAIAAVSQHHEEAVLMEQFKSLSGIISRHGGSISGKSLHKRSSFPPDGVSQHGIATVVRSSTHGMPTKWSEPKITISAPDEDEQQKTQPVRTEPDTAEQPAVQAEAAGPAAAPAAPPPPERPVDDTGQQRIPPVSQSALPGIEQQRRVSRTASVLRDLDAAETSRAGQGGEAAISSTSAAAPAPPTKGQRRASMYRTKVRRKSQAVAPAPSPTLAESSGEEEPPD